jgi:enoyl-CoA hydratase
MFDTGDARIVLSVDGGVATITLNRPDKLNALDFPMIAALARAAYLIDVNPDVRVAIITGAGDRAFCAGGDIAAWSALPPQDFGLQWVRHGHAAFDALTRLRQPLIAALNGHALGGGLELAACADFRIAEQGSKIALPETSIGIIPGWSGTQRLVRRFGAQTIRRLSFAGETFTDTEAVQMGLIDFWVAKGEGLMAAQTLAEKIQSRGSFATQTTKLMINAAEGEDAERAIEALGGVAVAASAELRENLAKFAAAKKK